MNGRRTLLAEGPAPVTLFVEDVHAYTPEQAAHVRAFAGDRDPWREPGGGETEGSAFLLNSSAVAGLDLPPDLRRAGSPKFGLRVEPYRQELLPLFRQVLGHRRPWRTWPAAGFALVCPEATPYDPLEDGLLARLARALPHEDPLVAHRDGAVLALPADRLFVTCAQCGEITPYRSLLHPADLQEAEEIIGLLLGRGCGECRGAAHDGIDPAEYADMYLYRLIQLFLLTRLSTRQERVLLRTLGANALEMLSRVLGLPDCWREEPDD